MALPLGLPPERLRAAVLDVGAADSPDIALWLAAGVAPREAPDLRAPDLVLAWGGAPGARAAARRRDELARGLAACRFRDRLLVSGARRGPRRRLRPGRRLPPGRGVRGGALMAWPRTPLLDALVAPLRFPCCATAAPAPACTGVGPHIVEKSRFIGACPNRRPAAAARRRRADRGNGRRQAHGLGRRRPDAPGRDGRVEAVTEAAGPVAHRLARGELPGDPKRIVGINTGGDSRRRWTSRRMTFRAGLIGAGAQAMLSEEAEGVIAGAADGLVSVAIDPIDGSQSIGIGALLGTLFAAIRPADRRSTATGRAMLAAGYVSFGHSVDLGFSVGDGVVIATLDPVDGCSGSSSSRCDSQAGGVGDRLQCLERSGTGRPACGPMWKTASPVGDGPRGRDFNMRWLAAAVGELTASCGGAACSSTRPTGARQRRDGCGCSMRRTRSPISASRPAGRRRTGPGRSSTACPRRCTSTCPWSSGRRRSRDVRAVRCARR